MKVPRLYSAEDGRSLWDELEITLTSGGLNPEHVAASSPVIDANGLRFMSEPAGLVSPWHSAPFRVYVFILTGEVDVETPDGTKKHFGPGELFLAENLTGEGHRTITGPKERTFVLVPLAD